MSRLFNRKSAAIGGAIFLIAIGGAYAYWTNGGSGSGSAATGTNAAITINQTSTPTALYPGGPTAALSGTFTNSNSGPVYVTDLNATIASVTRTAAAIAALLPCGPTDYQLNGFPKTIHAEVPAGTGGAWTGPSIQLLNTATNQDGCKGATVNLTYSSN